MLRTKIEDFLTNGMQDTSNFIGTEFILDVNKIADPEFKDEIIENPIETLIIFEDCLQAFLKTEYKDTFKREIYIKNIPLEITKDLESVRCKDVGRLYVFEGQVKKITKVKLRTTRVFFECLNCLKPHIVIQTKRKITYPICDCKKSSFRIIGKDYTDLQMMDLEVLPENLKEDNSSQRLHILLEGGLTKEKFDKTRKPGQKIKVTAIVKEMPEYLQPSSNNTISDFVAQAKYLELLEKDYDEIAISKSNVFEIETLSRLKPEELFDTFKSQIAPAIYGHNNIKEAIALMLFSGVTSKRKDGTLKRGIIHILLIGEAGQGKSQLLESARALAPKSRQAVGGQTSNVGLTAMITRDEITGDWSLEAGAMVLANNGILTLDEIDKMNKDESSALHQAMESLKITKTKAGINATLPTRTSVLAAGNPKYGRFDDEIPIIQQIKLPLPLITRFDVIFAVKDKMEEEIDEGIVNTILDVNTKGLTINVDRDLLRKYIAYARKKIKPKLTQESNKLIKEYYLSLRKAITRADVSTKSVPITPRQIDGIIRLSEAHARMRLSDKVEEVDVKVAIRIMNSFIKELGVDPDTGEIDIDRISGTKKREAKSNIVIETTNELLQKHKGTVEIQTVIGEVAKKGISEAKAEEMIGKLINNGDYYEPKTGKIRKI